MPSTCLNSAVPPRTTLKSAQKSPGGRGRTTGRADEGGADGQRGAEPRDLLHPRALLGRDGLPGHPLRLRDLHVEGRLTPAGRHLRNRGRPWPGRRGTPERGCRPVAGAHDVLKRVGPVRTPMPMARATRGRAGCWGATLVWVMGCGRLVRWDSRLVMARHPTLRTSRGAEFSGTRFGAATAATAAPRFDRLDALRSIYVHAHPSSTGRWRDAARQPVRVCACSLPPACRSQAQGLTEAVGARALGMAGAFVAVADDATATHWNPAGLVGGGPAGLTIGLHHFQIGNQDAPPAAGAGEAAPRSPAWAPGRWACPTARFDALSPPSRARRRARGGPARREARRGHRPPVGLDGLVVGSTVASPPRRGGDGGVIGATAGDGARRG